MDKREDFVPLLSILPTSALGPGDMGVRWRSRRPDVRSSCGRCARFLDPMCASMYAPPMDSSINHPYDSNASRKVSIHCWIVERPSHQEGYWLFLISCNVDESIRILREKPSYTRYSWDLLSRPRRPWHMGFLHPHHHPPTDILHGYSWLWMFSELRRGCNGFPDRCEWYFH